MLVMSFLAIYMYMEAMEWRHKDSNKLLGWQSFSLAINKLCGFFGGGKGYGRLVISFKLFILYLNPNSPKSSNLNTILHTP